MGRRQRQPVRQETAKSPLPSPTGRQRFFLGIAAALLALWVVLLVTLAVAF